MAIHATDWISSEFLADPYAYYAAIRASEPVHYDPVRKSWMLMRYDDVAAALKDDTRLSAHQHGAQSMLVSDPPAHTRLRTLVSKAFTARAVAQLDARIRGIVEELLDAAAARGAVDAIADFAYPLPITVIAELLGVEPERRDFFREASQKIAVSLGPMADAAVAGRAIDGRNDLIAYFIDLIERRKGEPRDDLVSALIAAEDRGDILSVGELLAMLVLLLVGGHETTVNLIGNGLFALLRHPDQLELLRAEASVEKTAIEELLRFDSPVQYTGRVARMDFELRGQRIRTGQGLRMILGSANHDPEMFDQPGRLDLTRDPCPHLAFGAGIHYCLGAQLARLEGRIAITSLIRRFPRLKLAVPAASLRWRPAPVLRGLESLPIVV
jgi:hypothetical protein